MGVNTYQDDLLSNQNGSKLMASNGFPSNITNKTITEKNTISRWITYKTCGFQSISRWITYKKIVIFNGYVTFP